MPSQSHFDVVPLSVSLTAVPGAHVYLGPPHTPATASGLLHAGEGLVVVPPLIPAQSHVHVDAAASCPSLIGVPSAHEYLIASLHAPLMMSPLLHVVSLVPPQLPAHVHVDVVPLSDSLVGVPSAHEYRNASLQAPLTLPPAQPGSAMLHRPESAPAPRPSQVHVDVVPLSVSLAGVPGAHEYCDASLHTPGTLSALLHGPEGLPPAMPSQIHDDVVPLSDSPTALPGEHEYLATPHTPLAAAAVVHNGRPEELPAPRPLQLHVYDAGGPGT
jgi:hypothetical protein